MVLIRRNPARVLFRSLPSNEVMRLWRDGRLDMSITNLQKVFKIGLSYSDDARDSQLQQIMDEFPNISGFNYRIARHKVGNDAYYRIHECFYDENGKVVLLGRIITAWRNCRRFNSGSGADAR